MLDEYAKITETSKEKTDVTENTITDEFIEKLAKKVANVLMQSADENNDDNNDNENNDDNNDNDNENNDNDNDNENNDNDNDNENE